MTALSRRSLLKGAATLTGAAALSRAAPALAAATDKSALLCIFMDGGYNALFASADSFVSAGKFGCTADNVSDLGRGLVVDKLTLGSTPAFALGHMASVGIAHGQTAHESAQAATWAMGDRSYPLVLAKALGGDAPVKAAFVGAGGVPNMVATEGDVSMQGITDMTSALALLGAVVDPSVVDPSVPDRGLATNALISSTAMSRKHLLRSPNTLRSVRDSLSTGVNALQHVSLTLDYPALCQGYNVPVGTTVVSNFTTQMMAAEVMVLAGANVVVATFGGWDSHGDTDGQTVRGMMSGAIMPGLNVFLNRMLTAAGRNVTVAIFGDFARSLPGSDHQGNVTATVIGKNVLNGTTGRCDSMVGLPPGPSGQQLWAYLAAVSRCPTEPFGSNPHTAILG